MHKCRQQYCSTHAFRINVCIHQQVVCIHEVPNCSVCSIHPLGNHFMNSSHISDSVVLCDVEEYIYLHVMLQNIHEHGTTYTDQSSYFQSSHRMQLINFKKFRFFHCFILDALAIRNAFIAHLMLGRFQQMRDHLSSILIYWNRDDELYPFILSL